jgi:hypothetical protein
MNERDDWRTKFTDTDTKLKDTTKKLQTAEGDLERTKRDLATTRRTLQDTEAEANKQRSTAERLDGELKAMSAKWKDADQRLSAWNALGLSPDQIRVLQATNRELFKVVAGLERDKVILNNKIEQQETELAKIRDPDFTPPLPPGLMGKVTAVDPKFDFIVLNVGQAEGVLRDGQMLISRDGKLVAKVRIKHVEPDRCIANVLPGWKLTDVFEGDIAVSR